MEINISCLDAASTCLWPLWGASLTILSGHSFLFRNGEKLFWDRQWAFAGGFHQGNIFNPEPCAASRSSHLMAWSLLFGNQRTPSPQLDLLLFRQILWTSECFFLTLSYIAVLLGLIASHHVSGATYLCPIEGPDSISSYHWVIEKDPPSISGVFFHVISKEYS